MAALISKSRNWRPFFAGVVFASIAALTSLVILSVTIRELYFFSQIAFGLGVTGVVAEWFRFPMDRILSKVLAIPAIGMFGVSDYIWGGQVLGQYPQTFFVFTALTVFGFLCVYLGVRDAGRNQRGT